MIRSYMGRQCFLIKHLLITEYSVSYIEWWDRITESVFFKTLLSRSFDSKHSKNLKIYSWLKATYMGIYPNFFHLPISKIWFTCSVSLHNFSQLLIQDSFHLIDFLTKSNKLKYLFSQYYLYVLLALRIISSYSKVNGSALSLIMIMKMMNCFCVMVDQWKVFNLSARTIVRDFLHSKSPTRHK